MKRAIEDSFPIVEINRLAVPERNAFKPIYQMHKWFARRASCVFRAILLGALKPLLVDEKGKPTKTGARLIMDEFYKDHTRDPDTKGAVVLDPFMGGGTTIVEALRLGCKVIGVDLNPVSWFIVKTEVEPVNVQALEEAFERLANRPVNWSGKLLRNTLLDLYKTECPCCHSQDADIMYTFWVKSAVCHNRLCPARSGDCGVEVPLFSDYVIAQKKPSVRYWPNVCCPNCKKTFDWETEPAALVAERKLMVDDSRTSAGQGRGNMRWAFSAETSVYCPWCEQEVKPLPSSILGKKGPRRERKKVPLTVLLCPKCECVWQWRGELAEHVTCPACKANYDPHTGTLRDDYDFICQSCGNPEGVLDSLRKLPADQRLRFKPYAIEGYCPHCAEDSETDEEPRLLFADIESRQRKAQSRQHSCWLVKNGGKFYKQVTAADVAKYQAAAATWEREASKLPYPKQKIPFGYQTVKGNDLPGHGYVHWHQLFNTRQLLGLSTLLRAIDEETDQVLKEMLLSGFFQLIRNQCLLCFYDALCCKLSPALSRKDFAPPKRPVENSVWGTVYGRGTFVSIKDKILAGKKFCSSPFDRIVVEFKPSGESVLEDVPSFEEIAGTPSNARLEARNVLDLDNSDAGTSADHVVTDPPYASNVNYSEVSDFFYVWLRLTLARTYAAFTPDHTPKAGEIIAQKVRGRSLQDFQKDLAEAFRKAGEYLKPDGLLVFTYHHEANAAWEAVLEAVMNAGFTVEAAYPYESEARKSGSMGAQKIAYDIIHVCKRRRNGEAIQARSWAGIRPEIRQRAREEIRAIETGRYGNEPLSPADVNIVLIGKCLEQYSRHYGRIVDHEGNPVPLHDALEEIKVLVDQLTNQDQELPTELEAVDPPSYVYLTCLSGRREIKSDEVHKATRGILEPEELLKAGLMTKGRAKGGRTYEIKSPIERLTVLKAKFGSERTAPQIELFDDELAPAHRPGVVFIDYVHLLLALVEAGESVLDWIEKFRGRRPEIRAALEYMARKYKAFIVPTQTIIGLMDERTLFTRKE